MALIKFKRTKLTAENKKVMEQYLNILADLVNEKATTIQEKQAITIVKRLIENA